MESIDYNQMFMIRALLCASLGVSSLIALWIGYKVILSVATSNREKLNVKWGVFEYGSSGAIRSSVIVAMGFVVCIFKAIPDMSLADGTKLGGKKSLNAREFAGTATPEEGSITTKTSSTEANVIPKFSEALASNDRWNYGVLPHADKSLAGDGVRSVFNSNASLGVGGNMVPCHAWGTVNCLVSTNGQLDFESAITSSYREFFATEEGRAAFEAIDLTKPMKIRKNERGELILDVARKAGGEKKKSDEKVVE